MKQFGAFVEKEFKHIFRDSRTVLILLVMPLVLICLFGYALSTEVKGSRVLVVDQVKDQESRKLIQKIEANNYFSISGCLSDVLMVDDLLKRGEADLAVIISRDKGIQIIADGSEPNQAQTRTAYLSQILIPATAQLINSRMLFNPQLKSSYNFVPGVIGLILLLICIMMTSISIVKEKEMGSMEILLASPLPPIYIIIAKLIPYIIVSSVNVGTILLLSYFVLNIPVAGSIIMFILITLVYILVALALGLFISTIVSSQLAAMLISILMIVPAIYLSAMIFPLESMPVPAQYISVIVPTRWYIDAARKILIQGVEVQYVMKDFCVLAAEALVFISISVKMFRTRL